MAEKVPKEQLVVQEILAECGVTEYEPGAVAYLMDFAYGRL